MNKTSVVLADDHSVVRQGLRTLLEAEGALSIVGEANDGLETAKMVEDLQPDVLVVDLMMGGMNGIEVARHVTKRSPKTKTVILSMYGNEGYVMEALRVGAKAYVLKEATASELLHAIREVMVGRRYLSAPLSEQAINAYLQKAEGTTLDPYDTLTTREREVLYLVAQDCTNADIAKKLFISSRTVEVHRANMMRKLGLRTRSQLLRYAIQRGVLVKEE